MIYVFKHRWRYQWLAPLWLFELSVLGGWVIKILYILAFACLRLIILLMRWSRSLFMSLWVDYGLSLTLLTADFLSKFSKSRTSERRSLLVLSLVWWIFSWIFQTFLSCHHIAVRILVLSNALIETLRLKLLWPSCSILINIANIGLRLDNWLEITRHRADCST